VKVPFIPFSGAIAEAAGTIYEKYILRKKNLNYKDYNLLGFLAITLLLIPVIILSYFLFPVAFPLRIESLAFETKNLLILLVVIVFSIFANLLTYFALKWEKVTEIEPLRLMQPLFAIFMAFFIFSSERTGKTGIIIAAIIASLALIFSHIKKHHFQFNKYAMSAIFGSFFFALEMIISNLILEYYPPLVFYFIRCLGILLLGVALSRPKLELIDKKTWKAIFSVAFIWIIYRLLLYRSYLSEGPITTTLLFMLTPIFIYVLAYFYLKEKLTKRNIIASIIILICVGYALFSNGS
jgi:drug/metabolite transporter (DMT)-like permease